jgi:hypothetical protein
MEFSSTNHNNYFLFRQLHSGADALKLASQLLTSIDKFTNLHDDVDKGD